MIDYDSPNIANNLSYKTVNAISVLPGVSETLTAFYSMKDTSGNTIEEELGMLNLIAYDKIIRNVYLVPVNTDVSNAEFEMIKQTLNTTYAQAVSEWSLTLHPRFDVAQSEWDVSPEDEIFQAEDENNRMDYTREQKEIYRAFKSQMDPDNDAWYVFIIPHTTNNTGINGYAIFGKQWVYIYKANAGNDMAHTITHELGHAAFSLRHTFSRENEYVVTQNSTQNLMDYTGGTELNKYQWDYIHNPEFTFAFLQDESEGEMVSIPDLLKTIRQGNFDGKRIIEITQDGCPENAYREVPVGNAKLRYFAIHCSDDFETIPLEPQTTSFTEWKLPEKGNQILIIPGSKNTVEFETTLGWAKRYQFFEAKDMPPPLDYAESDNLLFSFIVLREDADKFERYLYGEFLSDTIKIFITRTQTGTNSTTGTLKTDDEAISGYTVELPRGTDNECKTICTDDEAPFDCYCIAEGTYNFEINTNTYDDGNTKNHSLRIVSTVQDGRTGVLVHGGQDDAKGWSQGCILPMPNEPKKNLDYKDRHKIGRNNTKEQSVDFAKEILDWVRLREAEIKKNNKDIKKVEKQIIITKTF